MSKQENPANESVGNDPEFDRAAMPDVGGGESVNRDGETIAIVPAETIVPSPSSTEATSADAALSTPASANANAGTSARRKADVMALFRRLHGPLESLRSGDRESLRDHLVLLHTPLVEHCARNFVASGEPLDDLVQEGYVGLIKAVDRFDPEKGVRFSTYACHLITGEIRHYLRDLGRLIHEPGWHFELRQRISRTNDQLTQKLGRAPEPEDIARSLGIEASSVRDVLKNQQILTVEYLDAESDREGDEGGGSDSDPRLASSATTPDASETRVEDQMMLGLALPRLRELEKKAITLFFFEDCTKTEIAKRLDISVNHAAYLIKRGVEGLRQIIEENESGVPGAGQSTPRLRRAVQERSRAAYLLELATGKLKARSGESTAVKPGAGRPNRRSMKLVESFASPAFPVPKRGVASFAEFALWVDEEVLRAARYAQEFSLLWLRVSNWDEVVAGLEEEEKQQALVIMQSLVRRCCRATDKIATLSQAELSGLHLLILMPHTGEAGHLAGQRWIHASEKFAQLLEKPAPLPELETKFAFILFPRDGKTADDLFIAVGQQLNA